MGTSVCLGVGCRLSCFWSYYGENSHITRSPREVIGVCCGFGDAGCCRPGPWNWFHCDRLVETCFFVKGTFQISWYVTKLENQIRPWAKNTFSAIATWHCKQCKTRRLTLDPESQEQTTQSDHYHIHNNGVGFGYFCVSTDSSFSHSVSSILGSKEKITPLCQLMFAWEISFYVLFIFFKAFFFFFFYWRSHAHQLNVLLIQCKYLILTKNGVAYCIHSPCLSVPFLFLH